MSHAFAEFILDSRWNAIPARIQHKALDCLLDVAGCTIAGSQTPAAEQARSAASCLFGTGELTLFGTTETGSAPGVCLANGFAANAFDLDDGYRPLKGHPSALVFPVVLAAAEESGCTGREFLSAYVAGVEVAIRAGHALHGYYDFYHGTGSWAPVGASAAATALLGGDTAAVARAAALAEFYAPLTPETRAVQTPSMVKDGIGWGAVTAFASARMALDGITAPPSLLEKPETAESFDHEYGQRYRIEDLYFKQHPSCRWTHPAIDAALDAKTRTSHRPEDIASVTIETFDEATTLASITPATLEQAQFSLPWLVAIALVRDHIDIADTLPRHLEDPRDPTINALASTVKLVRDETLDAAFPRTALARATLEFTDGTTSQSDIRAATGDPDNPLTAEQLHAKFDRLTHPVLDQQGAAALSRCIATGPDLPDITALLRAATPSGTTT
ncbi:MmgE/PrpD family protein [Sciscionella marina]|uniref:MmgE/PrpD family protein n=1 Tax=Sciscionella marina TaxID=508770 RepID=UPI000374F7C6|nr:MmgE/PrpD family protein [Sciscionella marina]